jgi:hypothetical protein
MAVHNRQIEIAVPAAGCLPRRRLAAKIRYRGGGEAPAPEARCAVDAGSRAQLYSESARTWGQEQGQVRRGRGSWGLGIPGQGWVSWTVSRLHVLPRQNATS